MNRKRIHEKLLIVLGRDEEYDERKISLKTKFVSDLGMDSIGFLHFIISVEDEFDISIDEGSLGNWLGITVDNVLDLVYKLVNTEEDDEKGKSDDSVETVPAGRY